MHTLLSGGVLDLMSQYEINLYDFCSDEVTYALNKFCQRVNNSDADVLIIMAHKAVLLFDLLLAQGHIAKRAAEKIIISNLALDYDCSYLEGKKVAILDDIVISGTTIASTINKLMSVRVRQDDIDVITIAVDQDYFNMNFENTKGTSVLHCDFFTKDAPCIELSALISKVFSYYGIPYDVDFPVYEQIPVSQKMLDALHNNLLWTLVDVSNGNQRTGNIDVYTIFPGQSLLERLWTVIGADLGNCADIKLRLYIKQYPNGSQECCVVPMCLFKEIPQNELNALYDLLKPANQALAICKEESWKAQMRYLEFYIAHQMFIIFSEFTSLNCKAMFYENTVKQLFGPIDGDTIYHHLNMSRTTSNRTALVVHRVQVDCSKIMGEYRESNIYTDICKESINWRYGSKYQKGCWVNQFIFSFFLWWYDTKEIFVRNQLKAQRLHYTEDYQTIQPYLYRLQKGLSMSALRQMLQALVADLSSKLNPSDKLNLSDQEAESVISAFIDRAIDEGIIVPTIHCSEDGKYLCRAYRHGEDLPFGAADQYRLVYFLHSLGMYIHKAEGCKVPAVAEISLEKMIVLFYQMGLKRGNIFNRFLGFNETEIIHSFLSIHGSIQGYTHPDITPHIYSEKAADGTRYITWLTTWLYEAKLIGKLPEYADVTASAPGVSAPAIPIMLDKAKEYLAKNQRSAASDEILCSIDSIAELITTWYNGIVRKLEFRDDATALTSCANRFVYLSAIATEVHYFNNYWKNQAKHALEETNDSRRLVNRLTDTKDNRQYTDNITQGLYSGREKILWRHSDMGKGKNKAQEVIDMVARDFLGSTSATVWKQIWSRVDEEPEKDTNRLELYTNMAEAFLYFFSASFECLRSTDFWNCGTLPPDFASYKSCYLERALRIARLDSIRFDTLEEIARQNGANLKQKGEQLDKLVCEALFSSEQCVKMIEGLVRDMDPTYTVSYKSVLILDIAALDPNQIEPLLLRFWKQLPDDVKTELNLIRFPRGKENHSPFYKYGIFFGHIGRQSLDVHPNEGKNEVLQRGKFLYSAFEEICRLFNGRLYQIRGILLPHIIQEFAFNHNLQCNIDTYASDFYKSIVKPLETCYNNEWKMQLVLGLDRHVDQKIIQDFQNSWKICKLNLPIDGAEWVTNCVLCGKNPAVTVSNPNLMDRIAYSQLKVKCGKKQGLGLLLRLSDRVVCISCNHIFVESSQKGSPYAESAYAPGEDFSMKILTPIHSYHFDTEILPAQDEIILLEPCWDGNIPFDLCMLISLEDWADPETDAKCKCYGCNSEGLMKWVSSIHVGGAISKGYYQIDDDANHLDEIEEGFSGGIYVKSDPKTEQKIIGIHDGRFDGYTRARMIPSAPVRTTIDKLFRKEK